MSKGIKTTFLLRGNGTGCIAWAGAGEHTTKHAEQKTPEPTHAGKPHSTTGFGETLTAVILPAAQSAQTV